MKHHSLHWAWKVLTGFDLKTEKNELNIWHEKEFHF